MFGGKWATMGEWAWKEIWAHPSIGFRAESLVGVREALESEEGQNPWSWRYFKFDKIFTHMYIARDTYIYHQFQPLTMTSLFTSKWGTVVLGDNKEAKSCWLLQCCSRSLSSNTRNSPASTKCQKCSFARCGRYAYLFKMCCLLSRPIVWRSASDVNTRGPLSYWILHFWIVRLGWTTIDLRICHHCLSTFMLLRAPFISLRHVPLLIL